MAAIQNIDIQFKALSNFREWAFDTSTGHREEKVIPKDEIINIFQSFQDPVSNNTIYTGIWSNAGKDYIVIITDKYVDDGRVKLLGGGKRRKSRKTRSKSKRRHTRKKLTSHKSSTISQLQQ